MINCRKLQQYFSGKPLPVVIGNRLTHIYCDLAETVIASGIMKQYVIDELRYQDYEKIKIYFDESFGKSDVEGIYWLPLDPEMLTGVQTAHTICQPYYFALDLAPDRLSCELLVRTRSRIRCDCIAYANERQRNWIIKILDAVLEQLEIIN